MQKKSVEIEYRKKIKEIEFIKNSTDIHIVQRNKTAVGMEVKKIISRFGLWDEIDLKIKIYFEQELSSEDYIKLVNLIGTI